MKLYSAWYCPFAQRAWMALVYKGLDFEYIEIDPYEKTESWLEISRGYALVPVLVQSNNSAGDTTVVESNRILEYLDDYYPDSSAIFSANPNRRAEQKFWMDYIGKNITPYFYRYLKTEEKGEFQDESRNKMLEGLAAFTQAMDSDGPFFSGADLSAVDIALIPFSYRIEVLLGHYKNFALPQDGDIWLRYRRWYNAVLEMPAFQATATDHENYQTRLTDHYLPYSQAAGRPT